MKFNSSPSSQDLRLQFVGSNRSRLAWILLFCFWGFCLFSGALNDPSLQDVMVAVLILSGSYQFIRNGIHFWGYKKYRSERKSDALDSLPSHSLPLLSILIPAFNEEEVIERTLQSVVQLDYPQFEVLVIDDGSRDSTARRVRDFSQKNSVPVRLIQKENSGKAASLNFGISESRGEFLLCMDADSRLQADGVREAVERMLKKPTLSALGGVVEPDMPQEFLALQQQMEYLTGNFQKAFLSLFNLLNIVPGPIGLFRRDILLAVEGYTTEAGSFAEDTELTLRLLAEGHEVAFEPKMRAFTQVPRDWHNLMKQRYRWNRGIFQALFKVLPGLMSNNGKKRQFAFGTYLLSEHVLTLGLEFGVFVYFVTKLCSYGEITFLSEYLSVLIVMDFGMAMVALNGKESLLRIFYRVLACRFSYSIMLMIWRVFALFEEARAMEMGWNKVQRYSTSDSLLLPPTERAHG